MLTHTHIQTDFVSDCVEQSVFVRNVGSGSRSGQNKIYCCEEVKCDFGVTRIIFQLIKQFK